MSDTSWDGDSEKEQVGEKREETKEGRARSEPQKRGVAWLIIAFRNPPGTRRVLDTMVRGGCRPGRSDDPNPG